LPKRSKKLALWVIVEASTGVASIIALITMPGGVPQWGVILLTALGVLSFLRAAYDSGILNAAPPISRSIKTAVVFLVILGVMIWLGRSAWPTVRVSPGHVTFNLLVPHENYIFSVINRTPSDVYKVRVEFRLKSPNKRYGGVSVQIPTSSRKPIMEGSVFSDTTGLICHDPRGGLLLLISVYRLIPNEVREISFTGENVAAGTALYAEVVSFTATPQPRIDNPLQASETFVATEPMTCNKTFVCSTEDGLCRPSIME